jgi:hypothetical protein
MKIFPLVLLALAIGGGGAAMAQKPVEAYGRVFIHNNGQITETQKMGDSSTVRQDTYTKDHIRQEVRIFKVDSEGRLRSGVIYDGKENAIGSTRYTYDAASNQLQVEELYNNKGQLVRRLFYPGALKDPRFAKRMVAFSYNPDKPEGQQEVKEIKGPVRPIVPVTKSNEDFEPGVAQGTAAPTPQEAAAAAKNRSGTSAVPAAAAAPEAPKRASWLKQKNK